MFTPCTGINNTNFDETLLLAILSKFKLTSLVVQNGDKDEYIFMSLLQMASIQETLDNFIIYELNIFKCTSVVDLLVEFKKIKTTVIYFSPFTNIDKDKLEELKQEIWQFEKKLKKKHSEIEISIHC